MDINAIYTDFWEYIATYLGSDDLYNYSLTCKQANRACKRPTIQKIISFPMSYPFKLTYEQRSLIKNMETQKNQRFKLIHGDVGSGKTIASTSYAIRNYCRNDSDSKVVMCGPPNLVKMWWKTLREYFGIEPAVFHGTNKQYTAKNNFKVIPNEKFILFSYRVLGKHSADCETWFQADRDLLIIDEAHHQVHVPFTRFKEVIGLSATTTKKSGLSNGIKHILRTFELDQNNCTYTLNKNIIARKLPPVHYHPYMLSVHPDVKDACLRLIEYTYNGDQDMRSVPNICKQLSHPEILDLKKYHTGGAVMVGRKRCKMPIGNEKEYNEAMVELRKEECITDKQIQTKIVECATFDIMKLGLMYPKYVQALHIIKEANLKGDKVILFDNSTEYLPFLHKFLVGYGINSYLFTAHYDVTGRQRQFTKFQEDPKPGVILSSITMLGEGQNITEANHVIFFTHTTDPTKYYQAVGRCWRYPQKKDVHVHLLFGGMFDRSVYVHACSNESIDTYTWSDILML